MCEYACEERLARRQAIYRAPAGGRDVWDAAVDAVAAAAPERVLEAGCGAGELAVRLATLPGAPAVTAVDQSPRMAALAQRRGVDARVGDVQALAFPDGAFDAAVAAFVLYHVRRLDAAAAELARVLRPGGMLVAVTTNADHLAELWGRFGGDGRYELSFSGENGAAVLARAFAHVEREDVRVPVTFPDWRAARAYVAATVTRSQLAPRLEPFDGPLHAHSSCAVFTAVRGQ